MPPVQRRTSPPKAPSPAPAPPAEVRMPSAGEQYDLAERRALQIRMQSAFVDLDELTSTDGFFAIISQKRKDGSITFGVWKMFMREGSLERTSFIPAEMGEKYQTFVAIVLERVAKLKADGDLPFEPYAERAR